MEKSFPDGLIKPVLITMRQVMIKEFQEELIGKLITLTFLSLVTSQTMLMIQSFKFLPPAMFHVSTIRMGVLLIERVRLKL